MLRLHYSIIAIILVLVLEIHGSCFLGQLKTETSAHGCVKRFCEYKDQRYKVGNEWTLNYPDCIKCSCSESAMSCCGFGIRAGVFDPPPGYQLKPGQCEREFVKIDGAVAEEVEK